MSGPYRKVFNDKLPDATQVVDPFHLVKLAGEKLDEVRRRVQQETTGHRGHKQDPLYRIRRLLVMAQDRLDESLRDQAAWPAGCRRPQRRGDGRLARKGSGQKSL